MTAGSAVAASGGGSGAGSAVAPGAPTVSDSICLTNCAALHTAVVGSTVQVSGTNLSAAKSVSFRARRHGKRIIAPVTAATPFSAQAVVPRGVRSGPLKVRDAYRQKSKPGKEPLKVRPKSVLHARGPARLADAEVTPNKLLVGGAHSANLEYLIGGGQPANGLRVDVVTSTGAVVQSFAPPPAAPNTTQSIAWNGTGVDGKPVPGGWYSFRVSTTSGEPLARATASELPNLGVAVITAIFPVRGRHSFGGPENAFGAPRAGHTHQGQDILAACGTKIVAAIGGTVQYAGYQGAAGNYVVIDQKGSAEDNMYAHLAQPSPLHTGDRVATGQQIGVVGATGDATGCHLHFEVWSAPGWYEGGQPYDPLPLLKAWDKTS